MHILDSVRLTSSKKSLLLCSYSGHSCSFTQKEYLLFTYLAHLYLLFTEEYFFYAHTPLIHSLFPEEYLYAHTPLIHSLFPEEYIFYAHTQIIHAHQWFHGNDFMYFLIKGFNQLGDSISCLIRSMRRIWDALSSLSGLECWIWRDAPSSLSGLKCWIWRMPQVPLMV